MSVIFQYVADFIVNLIVPDLRLRNSFLVLPNSIMVLSNNLLLIQILHDGQQLDQLINTIMTGDKVIDNFLLGLLQWHCDILKSKLPIKYLMLESEQLVDELNHIFLYLANHIY